MKEKLEIEEEKMGRKAFFNSMIFGALGFLGLSRSKEDIQLNELESLKGEVQQLRKMIMFTHNNAIVRDQIIDGNSLTRDRFILDAVNRTRVTLREKVIAKDMDPINPPLQPAESEDSTGEEGLEVSSFPSSIKFTNEKKT